jgi:hypothetical protein
MKIRNGTIDCLLSISGSDKDGNSYSDFQHHHWDIQGTSKTIDHTLGNTLPYTWTLNGHGHDADGTWRTINKSMPNLLTQAWINPANMVTLTQTQPFGTHELPATGTNPHPVSELTWPADDEPPNLMWAPNHTKPIVHEDTGQSIVSIPVGAGNDGRPSLGKLIIPGRDYTSKAAWWQKPATVVGGSAVWGWHINLIP